MRRQRPRSKHWSRQHVVKGMVGLIILLCLSMPSSPATEVQGKAFDLDLPEASLADALSVLAQTYDLQFVATVDPNRREKVYLREPSLDVLITDLLEQFEARFVEVDSLWIVDGTPVQESVEKYLETHLPPDLAEPFKVIPDAQEFAAEETTLESLMRERDARLSADIPPPSPEEIVVIPDQVSPQEPLWLPLRRFMQANFAPALSRWTVRPPEYDSGLLQREGDVLRLSNPLKPSLAQHASRWKDSLKSLSEPGSYPLWHCYYAPADVRKGKALLLTSPVTLAAEGKFSAVLTKLKEQVPADFEAGSRGDRSVALNVRDVPLWIMLQAFSMAVGVPYQPQEDALLYSFPQEDSLPGALYQRADPAARLAKCFLPGLWRPYVMAGVWNYLTEEQRKDLTAGQQIMIVNLSLSARRWLQTAFMDRHFRPLWPTAEQLEELLHTNGMEVRFVALSEGILYVMAHVGQGHQLVKTLHWTQEIGPSEMEKADPSQLPHLLAATTGNDRLSVRR